VHELPGGNVRVYGIIHVGCVRELPCGFVLVDVGRYELRQLQRGLVQRVEEFDELYCLLAGYVLARIRGLRFKCVRELPCGPVQFNFRLGKLRELQCGLLR